MPILPRTLEGEPTLRGLRASPSANTGGDAEHSLHPWARVSRVQLQHGLGMWAVLDEEGSPVRSEGRLLYISLRGDRANRLAMNAQARCFSRAWQAGTFDLAFLLRKNQSIWWTIAIPVMAAIGLLILVIGWLAPGLWRLWEQAPIWYPSADYQFLARAMYVMVPLLVLAPLFLLAYILYWTEIKPNVNWIHIDNHGLSARLKNGGETHQSWQALRRLESNRLCTKLEFQDGTGLRLRRTRAMPVRIALDLVQEHVLGERPPDASKRQRAAMVRIALYWLAGSALIAYCAVRFGARNLPSRFLPAFGLVFFGGILLVLIPTLPGVLIDAWKRRRRRRKRSRAKMCRRHRKPA